MLITVDADDNALVGKEKKMRVKASSAPIEPYLSLLLPVSRELHTLHLARETECSMI